MSGTGKSALWVCVLALVVCVGLAGCKEPAGGPKKGAVEAPKIDGDLSDAIWKDALKIEGEWTEVNTAKKLAKAPEVLLASDKENLYVAFRCDEPDMKKLVAEIKEHDGPVYTEDSVEIFLDPTGKKGDYYQVIVNTLGTVYDGKTKDAEWESKATAAVKKGEDFWSVEIAIPLASMGVEGPANGQTWMGNFCRNRQVTGEAENQAWADTGQSFHNPEAFKPFTLK